MSGGIPYLAATTASTGIGSGTDPTSSVVDGWTARPIAVGPRSTARCGSLRLEPFFALRCDRGVVTAGTPGGDAAAERVDGSGADDWRAVWPLAVVFGAASVPWTYGFVAGLEIPLWPSFVASAAYFAVRSGSVDAPRVALVRALASLLAGVAYGAGTLAVVAAVDGGPLALSLAVGAAMLLASLHGAIPLVTFAPGGFFGYATLFSVDAAGASVLGVGGLAGVTLATAISMGVGAPIGFGADLASEWLDDRSG